MNSVHTTTDTRLPHLHNMSTTSLLSNCNKDKALQNSVLSNKSNFCSHQKLNFKIKSKTPSDKRQEFGSSTKKFSNEKLSNEKKLKKFHVQCEKQKFELYKKNHKGIDILSMMNKV